MDLFSCFGRVFVINLPDRTDRRRDMERQLRGIGLSQNTVEYVDGVRPAEAGGWPSVGARGCFLSHYNVLRRARDSGLSSVAILEDDCDFSPSFPRLQGFFAERLAAIDWGMVHLGHMEPVPADAHPDLLPWTAGVRTTHFYAAHGTVLNRLVEFMDAVLTRQDGHPLGGPQSLDGAFSMFRAQNPDVTTLLACPNLALQRPSRSDIESRWFDKAPVLRELAGAWRRYRNS